MPPLVLLESYPTCLLFGWQQRWGTQLKITHSHGFGVSLGTLPTFPQSRTRWHDATLPHAPRCRPADADGGSAPRSDAWAFALDPLQPPHGRLRHCTRRRHPPRQSVRACLELKCLGGANPVWCRRTGPRLPTCSCSPECLPITRAWACQRRPLARGHAVPCQRRTCPHPLPWPLPPHPLFPGDCSGRQQLTQLNIGSISPGVVQPLILSHVWAMLRLMAMDGHCLVAMFQAPSWLEKSSLPVHC